MSSVEKKKKDARIKLFRRDLGLNFFGALAYQFQLDVHEMSDRAEGYIMYNKENLDKSGDGIIHLNRKMVSQPDYTHDNIIYVILHELLHILQKHGLRRGQREPEAWNFACDHVVDRDLREIGKVKRYKNACNIIEELDKEKPKCSAEQAYEWIRKKQKQNKMTISMDKKSGMIKVEDHSTGEIFYVNPQAGGQDQTENQSPDDKKKYKYAIDNFLSHARALYETMKDKGTVGGSLATYLDKILKVEIPWESLLEKAIKTNTIMKPDERSWRQLNKYFQPHGMTLPGYSFIEDNEGIGLLIVLADTSGSISDKNLKQFSSVIIQSMKFFKTILLITHDVPIHQEKEFDSDSIRDFYQFINEEGFKGRGGTSHKAVFDRIEELWEDNEIKDDLSMVISLTDNQSDSHRIYQDYRWIKNKVPLVFVLTPNGDEHKYEYDSILNIRINN